MPLLHIAADGGNQMLTIQKNPLKSLTFSVRQMNTTECVKVIQYAIPFGFLLG